MGTREFIFAVAMGCLGSSLLGSPLSDLASPSSEVREAAAKVLRAEYQPSARAKWEPLLEKIKVGDSEAAVLKIVAPLRSVPENAGAIDRARGVSYRLDDLWVLSCWFDPLGIVQQRTLAENMHHVWVTPPDNFTGVWIGYFINGQPSDEIHYRAGKYDGKLTHFHPNGVVAYVQYYSNHVADGEDTGFYSSGQMRYKGTYKAGVQVGTWIWYAEDGSVRSTRDMSQAPTTKSPASTSR